MNSHVTTKSTEPKFPRVTIMIPTYSQADIILRAVDSALAQDYPNLEIIVADDASPDTTANLIATRQDARLRYHRNPVNLGRVSNYRNILYNLATGDWIVNLDGDDFYTDRHFISDAIALAQQDQEILVVLAKANIQSGTATVQKTTKPYEYITPGYQLLYEIAYKNREFFHMATLYRRLESLSLGFYENNTLSSDAESICRLAVQGKIAYLDRYVGVWFLTKASASIQYDWKNILEAQEFWPILFREAVTAGMNPSLAFKCQNRIISHMAYGSLSFRFAHGQYIPLRSFIPELARRFGKRTAFILASNWRLYVKAASCLLHTRYGFRIL